MKIAAHRSCFFLFLLWLKFFTIRAQNNVLVLAEIPKSAVFKSKSCPIIQFFVYLINEKKQRNRT